MSEKPNVILIRKECSFPLDTSESQAMRSLRINLFLVVLPAVPLMGMFIFTTNNIENLAILGEFSCYWWRSKMLQMKIK